MSIEADKEQSEDPVEQTENKEVERWQRFDFVMPAAITLRAAGDMGGTDIEAVRRRSELFQQYCRDIGSWSYGYTLPHQVHGQRVRILTPQSRSTRFRATDGVISVRYMGSVAITVADCLPIYIAVPVHGFVGILHSGRRSTGILARAISILRKKYRVSPGDIHLLFGPAIGPCCYEVGAEVALPYQKQWGEETVVKRDGKYYLDMVRANEQIAITNGVLRFSAVGSCTHCDTRYHSHRRRDTDGTERMLALISPIG